MLKRGHNNPLFVRDAAAAANLTMRNNLLSCALGFALAVTGASAAEPAANAETVQNSGAAGAAATTGASGASGDLVKRLQRKPIAEKPTRDLFGSASWQPPPKPVVLPPPPAPVAPPLPYVFMGKMTQSGNSDIIFLTKGGGEAVYTVTAAGDVLDGIYRVDEIAAEYIALTYLPLKLKQVLSFAAGAGPLQTGSAPFQPRETPLPIPTRDVISMTPETRNPPPTSQVPANSRVPQPEIGIPAAAQ